MARFRRGKFPFVVLALQILFIALFAVFADYSDTAGVKTKPDSPKGRMDPENNELADFYPSKY